MRLRGRPDSRDAVVAALTGSYLFGALPREVIAALAATTSVRRLSRNEVVFDPGSLFRVNQNVLPG